MKLLPWVLRKKGEIYFRIIFILFVIILHTDFKLYSQNEFDVISNKWLIYTDAPNSLYNHISGQAYNFLDSRSKEIDNLKSLPDWKERQSKISETLFEIVGPFPEKTPLNAKTIKVLEKESYKLEHIIYESQPGFYVTSSLFIPRSIKGKAPAIIYCSGHSNNGYRYESYQEAILNLVSKGFIVFAFDPIGQGERIEYFDPVTRLSVIGDPDKQHSYAGTQTFISGSSLARYMIWDGIRAVDYLLTRKEVDSLRIGITGRSGGGTQSAYIAAFDPRIAAVAPECYITNFKRLFQTVGNQDAEQNFFNGIMKGIDQPDLLLVRAPKPELIITTTRDMFSIQGARETKHEVTGIYEAYNKLENFSMVEDDAPHESTRSNREAMYSFFQKHLKNPGDPADHVFSTLSIEEMQVTETGQVSTAYGSESVFSLNRKNTEMLIKNRQPSANDLSIFIPGIVNSAKNLSGYQAPVFSEEPVFTGRIRKDGYMIEKYFLKGEGDYVIPYLLMVPFLPNNKAVIYLHPGGKSVEADQGGMMEWFVKKGFTVLAPDMIGTGETGPGIFEGDSYIDSVSHNLWYASVQIGRSIVGIRAGDVVRLVNLLKNNRKISEIYGIACKEMSPVLLHAAAFETGIERIALIEPLCSYESIVNSQYYKSSFIYGVVPGALAFYDLPELAATLAPRKLLMTNVTDGNGNPLEPANLNKNLSIVKKYYQYKNAEKQLKIVSVNQTEELLGIFIDWLK